MSECKHTKAHHAIVVVNTFEDTGGFMADIRIECRDCKRPFQFLGLPLGLLNDGAAMSADGQEARLAIAPVGSVPQPLDGPLLRGFRLKLTTDH